MEKLRFNTMIAALMEFTNYLTRAKEAGQVADTAWQGAVDVLLLLLAPTAPHLAEELWERTGHSYSIHNQNWPVWDEALARELRTTQVAINEHFSWGLGPGIQHSVHGEALWQMGMTFGFRSVMVIYPEHGLGVVVLTNSDDGLPVAYDIAARALGGKTRWSEF